MYVLIDPNVAEVYAAGISMNPDSEFQAVELPDGTVTTYHISELVVLEDYVLYERALELGIDPAHEEMFHFC